MVVAALLAGSLRVGRAQDPPRPPLLQLEVTDSVGLPLPDAKLEVFAAMDRATFREWVPIGPQDLSEGVYLLRFSNPGYRTSVFSVALRSGRRVALRVRLGAERDTTRRKVPIEADEIRAIGIMSEGRATTDITKWRRVLDRDAIERIQPATIAALLRDAKGMHIVISLGDAGSYTVGAIGDGASYGCELPVMVNGDWRLLTTFNEANQHFGGEDVEALEYLPRAAAVAFVRRREDALCGLLILWVKQR